MRNIWQVAASALAAGLLMFAARPAIAASDADLGIEQVNGLQFLSTGSNVLYVATDLPAGVDTGFEVRVDVSGVDGRVRIAPEPGYLVCDGGSVIVCQGATSASGAKVVALRYTIDGNAAAGRAGRIAFRISPTTPGVTDPNPGNNSRSMEVEVRRPELGSDKEIHTTAAVGALGDTVTATLKVTNNGPNTELYFRLHSIFLSDPSAYEVVGGMNPCRGNVCEHKMIRPGETRTFTFKVKLIKCTGQSNNFFGWTTETDGTDPNPYNNYAGIYVRPEACASKTESGSSSGPGSVAVSPSATPSAEPSPSALAVAEPSAPISSATSGPAVSDAATSADVSTGPWAITVVALATAGLIGGGLWHLVRTVIRRRAQT